MNEILDKFLKLKPVAKLGITLVLVASVGAGYYFIFYSDLLDQIHSARQHQDQIRIEKASYEKRKIEYLAYRNELNELQEKQRDLLKALPKDAEIASFISNIEEQVQLAGVEDLSTTVEPEVPQDLYIRIPVRKEIRGTYHQITRFFKNISELRRIVNVENLSLTPDRSDRGDTQSLPTRIRAKFVCATFRFMEPTEKAAKKKK